MRKDKKRKRSIHDKLLIFVTVMAVIVWAGVAFYIESPMWSMDDLFWQVPVWLICWAWLMLFTKANDYRFCVQKLRAKKRIARKVKKVA